MNTTDPHVTAHERAEIARLVDQLPRNLDHGGPALRELRRRWGIHAGHIWPTERRLHLALRVIGDRRRHAANRTLTGARR